MKPPLPTLRRELVAALALVFVGALLVAATALLFLVPRLESAGERVLYVGTLMAADLAVFLYFGRYLVQRRVLTPIQRMLAAVENIAQGEYTTRLPQPETAEMARLADAVNGMAERLINHQDALSANIRSLEETNRQLTDARNAMVRAEKMASVGRLASGIAHEVGNPLGAILGYLGLVGRGLDSKKKELIVAAEQEARRIDRIVRGLLDYARTRDVKTRSIDVNGVIGQTLELIETQGRFTGIQVSTQLGADLPAVEADPYQLQQVLVNLLVNAGDALAGRRERSIEIRSATRVHYPLPYRPARRKDDPPGIDYSHRRRLFASGRLPQEDPFTPGGTVVEITVADNGPGIPPELLDQIFEPFVTTKEPGKGTGLGLAVSARLVDNMGGTIRAESPESGGARFTIGIPALEQLADRETTGAPLAETSPAGARG